MISNNININSDIDMAAASDTCDMEDLRKRYYIYPKRVVWKSSSAVSWMDAVADGSCDVMRVETKESSEGIVLDFGIELHGGLQLTAIFVKQNDKVFKKCHLRIRFGESVSEVMGDPNNDHAIHDMVVDVPFMSHSEWGQTGFRFVRIDVLDENVKINLSQIRAVALQYSWGNLGTFESSDSLLNQIYKTAARTTLLCCQEHLWDGIKRDRLVWAGDIHPQLTVLFSVFGMQCDDFVKKTLTFLADRTGEDNWVNNISSYSLWWLISVYEWYRYTGDVNFVKSLAAQITKITSKVVQHIDSYGRETLDGMRFLDWSSADNKNLVGPGLQAMMIWAMDSTMKLAVTINDGPLKNCCEKNLQSLKNCKMSHKGLRQNAAIGVLAGIYDAAEINMELFTESPMENMSSWFGGYYLDVKAMSGDIIGALDMIRKYWGGMLQLGATTFWEHFDISWLDNASRIDELPTNDKVDVHSTCGEHCYQGLRHSLCHGWASRPAAWLAENILGIKSLVPGMKKIRITPQLGDLEHVSGTFPTKYGLIKVSHEAQSGGRVKSKIDLPQEIEMVPN